MPNAAATQTAPLPSLAANITREVTLSLLGGIYASEGGRVEASDYAVNTLRSAADEAGLSRRDLSRFMNEEVARCKAQNVKTLEDYLRAKRSGSRFRISRRTRYAVFVQIAARGLV